MGRCIVRALLVLAPSALVACTGSSASSDGAGASSTANAVAGSAVSSTATTGAGGAASQSSASTGAGAAPADPCAGALLCETFDGYPNTTMLADMQTLGPWHAALNSPGAMMDLDGTHTISGAHALHVRIDAGATAGGRLFADGNQPLFQTKPSHVYGRMMMYIDPNGTSVHWTFFGESGDADSNSPVAGRRATYLMSSLPRNAVNTYSFVYGLEASGSDPYHDCYFQGMTAMPTATWACVAFDMDSIARALRMTISGGASGTVSVQDHGQGCVGTVPGDSPWYGPMVDQIYVGAWSFHPMDAPLEVWIDDLIVDTKPVDCPAP